MLTTSNGYGIDIPARAVTFVPEPALKFAIEKGCIECDEAGHVIFLDGVEEEPLAAQVDQPVKLEETEQDDEVKRAETIYAAIQYLIAVGRKDDFRLDNTPKVAAVTRACGFQPTGTEIERAFTRYQTEG